MANYTREKFLFDFAIQSEGDMSIKHGTFSALNAIGQALDALPSEMTEPLPSEIQEIYLKLQLELTRAKLTASTLARKLGVRARE